LVDLAELVVAGGGDFFTAEAAPVEAGDDGPVAEVLAAGLLERRGDLACGVRSYDALVDADTSVAAANNAAVASSTSSGSTIASYRPTTVTARRVTHVAPYEK
jgi:hypothetical protein